MKNIRIKNFIAVLLSIITCILFIGADVTPTKEFYVNDYADILSSDLEDHIISTSKELREKTGAQVVVLTINNLGGKDIKDYGLEVGRDWGIGDKDKNNGVLLLVSLEDRKVRIEVGRGLEGRLTDTKTGDLIRTYAKPDYGNDNFEDGTLKVYDAIISEVYLEYGMDPLEGYDADAVDNGNSEDSEYTFGDYLFIAIGVICLVGISICISGGIGYILYSIVCSILRLFGIIPKKKKSKKSHWLDSSDNYSDSSSWSSSDWSSSSDDCGGGGDFGGGGSDSDF